MNWHWILYNRVSVLQNPLNPQWVKRVLVHAHSVRDSLITRAIGMYNIFMNYIY